LELWGYGSAPRFTHSKIFKVPRRVSPIPFENLEFHIFLFDPFLIKIAMVVERLFSRLHLSSSIFVK